MEPIKVGNTIKTLRLQAGYTQHALADVLGVTDQAVSKWEREDYMKYKDITGGE